MIILLSEHNRFAVESIYEGLCEEERNLILVIE